MRGMVGRNHQGIPGTSGSRLRRTKSQEHVAWVEKFVAWSGLWLYCGGGFIRRDDVKGRVAVTARILRWTRARAPLATARLGAFRYVFVRIGRKAQIRRVEGIVAGVIEPTVAPVKGVEPPSQWPDPRAETMGPASGTEGTAMKGGATRRDSHTRRCATSKAVTRRAHARLRPGIRRK